MCFNCTGAEHRASECRSRSSCSKCKRRHHTSICDAPDENGPPTAPTNDKLLNTATNANKPVVYPVVIVNVNGVKCRALIDTGAGSSYASSNEWKERIDDVESARATETWHRIVQEVNKVGTQKTTKQCKDKIRNLKKSYKEAKANNNKTGRPRQTSPYYDSFDEVLGTRAVVTMPGVIQCGQAESDDM